MSRVWLVTGSGSGLGREIAEAALDAGHTVVATARNTEQLHDLVERHGKSVLPIELDVTDEDRSRSAVEQAVAVFGQLDVLVNNAGYGDARPFEQVSSADFRKLVETCLFGVVNLTRAVLPIMRRQKSGHIIQISSLGGRTAFPGNAAYFASKWGVGGFTEGVALEVAPFGVKMTSLEPGALRTNWGKRAHDNSVDLMPEYERSVGAGTKSLEGLWGNENGDPAKVARIILKIAEAEQLPPHILLGSGALQLARQAEARRTEEMARWETVSKSIDFSSKEPIADLPSTPGGR